MNDHITIKELISADFDGQATAQEKQLIDAHVKECVQCREYSKELIKLSATLDQWTNEDLSPDLEQKVQRGLKEVTMSREKTIMRQSSLFKVGVGGGGVLVVILAVLILSTQTYLKRSVQGRSKIATDEISGQFSADKRGRDADFYLQKQTAGPGSSVQYDPYYLSSEYNLKDKEVAQASIRSSDASTEVLRRQGEFQSPIPIERMTMMGIGGETVAEKIENNQLAYNAPTSAPTSQGGGYRYEETTEGNDTNQERRAYLEEDGEVLDGIGRRNRLIYQDVEYPAYAPQPNTEEYARIEENPFLEARYNPLSTFSIDVDTTSYSNIRRFLNQGQLPPADAVRIEEMVNYFDYDYPEPGWNQPFSMTTQASYCPWNPQNYLVQIGLKGKVMSSKKVPPSNLVFLIDVSGSMNQPNKLPLLKNAFRMFVDQLSENERVAIVVYAGSASVILDSTPGSEKWRISQAIDSLSAGGSTAGGAGIQAAYAIAQRNFIRNGNNRIILATDGDFNVGVSSDSELVQLIEDKRRNGIFLTILGFGNGNYKDAKMEQIADKGNGNYFYIDSLKEGHKVLVDELGSTLFTIAKDVKLQVEFNPAEVRAYRLIGYENRILATQDFNDDRKDAGEIGSGHTVTAFYEVVPVQSDVYPLRGVDDLKYQQRPNGLFTPNDVLTVKLRYKDPNGQDSKLIKKAVHRKEITNQPSADFQFGSAVAEFGLLLRNSAYRANASYDHVLMRARSFQGADKYGRKAEFSSLVEKARSLDHRQNYYAPLEYPAVDYPEYEPSGSNINFKGQ